MNNETTYSLQNTARGNPGKPLHDFYMIARHEDRTLDLFLYDYIEPDKVNPYTGETIKGRASADRFKEVLDLHPDAKRINLYVNCQGGHMLEALNIRSHLSWHRAEDKRAYVDGWSAAAASLVLTAFDEVNMIPGAMQHVSPVWLVYAGNAKQLRKAADKMDSLTGSIQKMFIEKSKGKLNWPTIQKLMESESWLTAEECVEHGLADRIVPTKEYRNHLQGKLAPEQSSETKKNDQEWRKLILSMMMATEFQIGKKHQAR